MNSIDLNIYNYNYDDLLNVFKINEKNNKNDNRYIIEKKIKEINNIPNIPEEIIDFYKKSQKIMLTLYTVEDKAGQIPSKEITKYVNKIKEISHFENYDETELTNKLLHNQGFQLNEPNYDSNKFTPGLNDKNNTNLISNTFINSVAPGVLNPLKRITQNQNINLNSCFRNNYYQTNPCDFLYIFPAEIKNILSMRLVSIEIPNSWYLFSHLQKNNIFQIEMKVNNHCTVYNIVIPDGNYDTDSLQSFLNTTYFNESSSSSEDSYLKYLHFSIDSYNLKSCFEIIENDFDQISFSLSFVEGLNQNRMNTMGWILGFRLTNYTEITDKIVSEGLFDGGGDRYIYVSVNDFQYNNNTINTVFFDKNILSENIIAKIPMTNGKLSLIVSDDNNPLAKIRKYTGPVNISRLYIRILDKFGNIIDLNHMDYSITFELELLYESFNFKNVTA